MVKNKILHEKVEQPFDGSKRKAFRALSSEDDMDFHLEMYRMIKGPVRNQLLWMRGIPHRMEWDGWGWNGNQRTMAEINGD